MSVLPHPATERWLWEQTELNPRPVQLSVLADFHEEQGDGDLAFALRWCARKGCWPLLYINSHRYYWSRGMYGKHCLPYGLYEVMACGYSGDTLRESIDHLAAGLATLRAILDD